MPPAPRKASMPKLALAVALLAVGLAGCSDGSGPEDTADGDAPVVTDPRDYSYLEGGGAPGSHIHDYWQGRDEVTVVDAGTGDFSASCTGCDDDMTVGWFQPADGDIVPQGTAWVNVTVTVDAATADHEGYQLWVQTATDGEMWRVGDLTSGQALTINGTQQRNDPPHYVLSLWQFEVRVTGSDVSFEGSLHLKAVAVRGLPLVPYPPHPDRWQGEVELTVLEDSLATTAYQVQDPQGGTGTSCYGGCPGLMVPANGTVVPYESGEVRVTLRYEPASVPAGLTLSYHGSDTRTFTPLQPEGIEPGAQAYVIPIEAGRADSPYAPRSLWEFDVGFDATLPVRAWTGEFTLTAVAVHSSAVE